MGKELLNTGKVLLSVGKELAIQVKYATGKISIQVKQKIFDCQLPQS